MIRTSTITDPRATRVTEATLRHALARVLTSAAIDEAVRRAREHGTHILVAGQELQLVDELDVPEQPADWHG